jgi:hypothetical protein
VLFPSGFLSQQCIDFSLSPKYDICPVNLIHQNGKSLTALITCSKEYRLWSYSLWNFLHPPVLPLGSKWSLPSTLFSNTPSLCSSLNEKDKVSHSYTSKDKVIILHILIFTFLDSRW